MTFYYAPVPRGPLSNSTVLYLAYNQLSSVLCYTAYCGNFYWQETEWLTTRLLSARVYIACWQDSMPRDIMPSLKSRRHGPALFSGSLLAPKEAALCESRCQADPAADDDERYLRLAFLQLLPSGRCSIQIYLSMRILFKILSVIAPNESAT